MHDQVAVGVGHRVTDLLEQAQSLDQRRTGPQAMRADRGAFYELHRHPRPLVVCHAPVE